MENAALITELDRLRATMISVATGGGRIDDAQEEFGHSFDSVAAELSNRGIENPLPFRDLWQWYGHWSGTEDLKTYQARRKYVATLFDPLVRTIQSGSTSQNVEIGSQTMVRQSISRAADQSNLDPAQLRLAIERIQRRIADVESLDPLTLEKWSPQVDALQASLDHTLSRVFGHDTVEYKRYRRTVNWAAEIPSFGVETTIGQYRDDVQKGRQEVLVMLRQAIHSLQEELAEREEAESIPARLTQVPKARKIVIGHGGSPLWRELKDFIRDRLELSVEEFNSVSVAGITTVDRLSAMLNAAAFAFLVMTAEDEQPDGRLRARENVVHEIGFFKEGLGSNGQLSY